MEYKKTNNKKYTLTKEQKEYIQKFFNTHLPVMNDWEKQFVYSLLKFGTITIPQREAFRRVVSTVPEREVLKSL